MQLDRIAAQSDDRSLPFLAGGGELGRLIAAYGWGATPLGPIQDWPGCLKTSVSLILRSEVPMVMLWGTDGIMIYNDAYAVFASGRHPDLLGSKVREGWPEVADFNDNVMKECLGGGTLGYRDQELTLYRSGKAEQVWMNLDYSPILDDDGRPAGVIAIVVETSAKVAAERWLSSERDRQRQMFAQAPGFVAMLFGPEHVFEITNDAYMQLVGHRDVLGLSVREALPEIKGQGYFELLDEVYATGKPFIGRSLKAEIQPSVDGPITERVLDLIYQPVRDPGGAVIGIFVQGHDVTDRVRAEDLLKRSEARFRTFAEAMPNQVWTSTAQGKLDWFNRRVYEFAHLPADGLDGDNWVGILHPDDVAPTVAKWSEALGRGGFYEAEFRIRRHDGAYRWHIARASPIHDANGAIVQWIGTNTDIHDQKQAEQALRDSERRLRLSQSAAGIASLELDIATGTVVGSEGFYQLWGLSPRESVHISVLENIVIPEDAAIRSTPETRVMGTAVPSVEYRIRRADTGELRWLSRTIDFVHDGAGRPIKMFGVMQDITERKEAQSRQQLLTHELEHRIKNILSIIAAIASQTLRNCDIDSARTSFIDRLSALAAAHDILNRTQWSNASMRQVIESTIAALPSDRIEISGPIVLLDPKKALSLSLAVNELATNSLKYGALSVPGGRVIVDWSVTNAKPDAAGDLEWRWREIDGPPVVAPSRKGFGTLLLSRVFGTDFGGVTRIEYHPGGVECVLTAPAPTL